MGHNSQEAVYSARETAERLGVSRQAVLKWINEGLFPNARKLRPVRRSPYRIPESDIVAFERQQTLQREPS